MYAFEFVKPKTVEEAVAALRGGEAKALAGGQTLIPTLKQRLAAPETLVSLSGIDALKGVSIEGGVMVIGAGTPHAAVAEAAGKAFPALASLAGDIGDPAVRNRGTIGGSLANNDPSADWPAAVLGTGATVVTDRREITADDFFQGLFTTALEEDEIITAVRFPIPDAAGYAKFDQPASRFALVGVFVSKGPEGVRVAVTGASQEGVFRWEEAEAALAKDFSAEAVEALAPPPAEDMISDIHGGGDYRAHLVKVMTKRALAACS